MTQCEDCDDCECQDSESEEPIAIDGEDQEKLKQLFGSITRMEVDQENADFYAFSSVGLRQLRETAVSLRRGGGIAGKEQTPLDWDLKEIALQIVGNKLSNG